MQPRDKAARDNAHTHMRTLYFPSTRGCETI